ncbi:hypothetical protein Purlil1_3637 [Purpureocillium lilacinum]|uniref:Uncharacterized protein n=1 Tax=Purpureocillium lilacinum TaxID=33203 RepID=A0ABR0C5Z0_PURLI|nr:hypothetical protein Purlil1_3637 [Purpureocillium lilacinum]
MHAQWRAPEVPGSNARQSSSVEQPRARHPGTHCRLPDDDAAMQAGHPTHVASHSPLPGSQGCSLHAEPPAAPIVRACVRAHGRENNAGRLCDATLNLEMARRRFSYLPFPPGRRQNQTTYQVGKQVPRLRAAVIRAAARSPIGCFPSLPSSLCAARHPEHTTAPNLAPHLTAARAQRPPPVLAGGTPPLP